MMPRKEGWENILDAEIEKARALTFEWGRNDCVTWAANVVLALTGADLITDLRGTYATKQGAYRLIRETGGTLAGCVDARLPRIPIAFAGRGDVVLWENSLGICTGINSFFLTDTAGLSPIKTLKCGAAWRVE